jgi:hypothetical protein
MGILDEGIAHSGRRIPVNLAGVVSKLVLLVVPEVIAVSFEQTDMVSHQGIANLLFGKKLDVMKILFDFTWDHLLVTILDSYLR